MLNAVILLFLLKLRHLQTAFFFVQNGVELQIFVFPVLQIGAFFQELHLADHVVDGTEAQLRHDFAHLSCHEVEHVHHVLGLAREERP